MIINKNIYGVIINSVIAVLFLYSAHYILFSDNSKIVSNTPDDASYYLKIAGNFSFSKGFTFDNINNTNGFQPLWEYLLIPVMFLSESQPPENMLRIVLFIQLVLISGSFLIFRNTLREYFHDKYILAFAVFFALFVFFNSLNGMETSLMIFMLSLLTMSAVKYKIFSADGSGSEFVWGVILGFLILSRLDLTFIALSAGLVLISGVRKDKIVRMFRIFSGTAIVMIPYLLYNLIVFGNIIPVSGYLKSGFPETNLQDKLLYLLKYRETYFFIITLLFLIWYSFFKKDKSDEKNFIFTEFIKVLIISNVFLFLYLLLFLKWVIFYWYFIPFSLMFSLSACIIFHCFLKDSRSVLKNILYFSLLVFAAAYWGIKIYNNYSSDLNPGQNNWSNESYKAALWTKSHTNPEDVIAMKDAGHFSFFSERNVINLDGLVNSFKYQEIIKNKKLNEYLTDNNVKYLSQHALWQREDITSGNYDSLSLNFMSHKYSAESDPVVLYKKNEVYRSEPYFDNTNKTVFVIWKLKP